MHDGRHYVVFARLRVLMSDGDGLRKGLGWKGASGIRASIIHSNMLKKGSDLAWRAPGFVEITCCDHRLLHKTTPEEFHHSCDLVAAAHARHRDGDITKTLLENIEKTEGIRYVPGGLAYDLRLRRLGFFEAITVDWVHTWLQDGVLTAALNSKPPNPDSAGKPPKPDSASTPRKRASADKPPKPDSTRKQPKPQKQCVNHEATRSQWLARSAYNGSKSFKYGVDSKGVTREYSTSSKAKAAATAWLSRQKV